MSDALTCIYCGRHRPPCHFYPMTSMTVPVWLDDDTYEVRTGQLCWDCDTWLRAGRPPRETPTEELEASA